MNRQSTEDSSGSESPAYATIMVVKTHRRHQTKSELERQLWASGDSDVSGQVNEL